MIAIIPARGGSKGLPGKNVKELLGKPLIAYTIEAALRAKGIHKVIVSTDSEEIVEVAKKYGAEVPFIRPDYLASDTASAVDVYIHAVEFLEETYHENIEKFMVLLPTAPLRDEKDIEDALDKFSEVGKSTLVSMTEAETPISWYYKKNSDGYIVNAGFDYTKAICNRQDNEKYYIPNGAIYILDYELLKNKGTYYDDKTIAYVMSKEKSLDIDTSWDFDLVEYVMKKESK